MENIENRNPSSEENMIHLETAQTESQNENSKSSLEEVPKKSILKPNRKYSSSNMKNLKENIPNNEKIKKFSSSTTNYFLSGNFLDTSPDSQNPKSVSFGGNVKVEEVECWKQYNVMDEKYKIQKGKKNRFENEENCLCNLW